jgi:hypothetical protein
LIKAVTTAVMHNHRFNHAKRRQVAVMHKRRWVRHKAKRVRRKPHLSNKHHNVRLISLMILTMMMCRSDCDKNSVG